MKATGLRIVPRLGLQGLVLASSLSLVLGARQAEAQIKLDDEGKVELYGDLRFRFESDWDSKRANGTSRSDRDRLRIRARIGLTLEPTSSLSLGFRLRSGSWDSQQSPHITLIDFDDNPTGDKHVVVDRWFVRFSGESTSVSLGRDGYPFWKQNELFWDDDATLAGAALRHKRDFGDSELSFVGGFFLNSDGMDHFNGNLAGGQVVYSAQRERVAFSLVSGVFFLQGEEGPTENLRRGNGARDYKIWTGHAQARLNRDKRPLTFGLDVMQNFEDYSPDDPDPVTAANHDQNTGFVASVAFGKTNQMWDWLVAYYYSRIETFAVHASYAQDDWIRWGSATQTDASDMKGHEIRFAMALIKNMNVVARLYLVDAITTVQDGKRFRVDLNYRF